MQVRYSPFFKIPRKIAKYFFSMIYPLVIKLWPLPKVYSIDETLDKIINDKSSICRFGDGEFLFIIDKLNLPFQSYNSILATKMKKILISKEPNILIGLPIGYHSHQNLNVESKLTWRSQISWIYPRLTKYLDLGKQYHNASMTRVYSDYSDKSKSQGYFNKLKKIWKERKVLLIEGEKSRLGVGNDLFDSATSVERILAPKHHAFQVIGQLFDEVVKHDQSKLVLIALGPTATVLAFDLAKIGYQALDIGNVDIEYEWYLRRSSIKEKVKGKYTSEAIGGSTVEDVNDTVYLNEIIKRFN